MISSEVPLLDCTDFLPDLAHRSFLIMPDSSDPLLLRVVHDPRPTLLSVQVFMRLGCSDRWYIPELRVLNASRARNRVIARSNRIKLGTCTRPLISSLGRLAFFWNLENRVSRHSFSCSCFCSSSILEESSWRIEWNRETKEESLDSQKRRSSEENPEIIWSSSHASSKFICFCEWVSVKRTSVESWMVSCCERVPRLVSRK